MATKITGMTAITAGDLDDTVLFETVDRLGASTKSTLAQIRTQLSAGALTASVLVAANPYTVSALTIGANTATSPGTVVLFNVAAGSNRTLFGQTAGLARWGLTLGDSAAEGGANVGSDFSIQSYDDTGAVIGTRFKITRSTGAVAIAGALSGVTTLAMGGALSGVTTIAASGQITTGANAAATLALVMNRAAGNTASINYQTAGLLRWLVGVTATAEGGGDAGSDFSFRAQTDAGTNIDAPLTIARVAGGAITMTRPLTATQLTLSTAVSKLLPGATSLSLRNHADSADNLILTDAGAATIRTSLTVTTGFGCNGTAAQTAHASGGALNAYGAGVNGFDTAGNASALYAMVVAIRAALVANGIMS